MKAYEAIFFDWDGTAVLDRNDSAVDVIRVMKELLSKGIKLIIISGTSYKNILGGQLGEFFSLEEKRNLFLGLSRGAFNYGFDEDGNLKVLSKIIPSQEEALKLHEVCFELHKELLRNYHLPTDITFSRDNYCKIDLTVQHSRGKQLFMQHSEIEGLYNYLEEHKFHGGLKKLMLLAEEIGSNHGLMLKTTSDAKYLEVGFSTKSDNVDFYIDYFKSNFNMNVCNCAFVGDEFKFIGEDTKGSDSFMLTTKTAEGDFFDVSLVKGELPKEVMYLGNGILEFQRFLLEQVNLRG